MYQLSLKGGKKLWTSWPLMLIMRGSTDYPQFCPTLIKASSFSGFLFSLHLLSLSLYHFLDPKEKL